jgi:hypothetical protein
MGYMLRRLEYHDLPTRALMNYQVKTFRIFPMLPQTLQLSIIDTAKHGESWVGLEDWTSGSA